MLKGIKSIFNQYNIIRHSEWYYKTLQKNIDDRNDRNWEIRSIFTFLSIQKIARKNVSQLIEKRSQRSEDQHMRSQIALKEKKSEDHHQQQRLLYARRSVLYEKTKQKEEHDRKMRILKAKQMEKDKLFRQICSEEFFWINVYKFLPRNELYSGLSISSSAFFHLSKTVHSLTLNLENVNDIFFFFSFQN